MSAYEEIAAQRARNHDRWGDLSIEGKPADYVRWLPTLGEEFGEVCETLTAEGPRANLRAELIDLAAVALMWIDAIDREAKPINAGPLCEHGICGGSGWYGSRWHNPDHHSPHLHCRCGADCGACASGDGFNHHDRDWGLIL